MSNCNKTLVIMTLLAIPAVGCAKKEINPVPVADIKKDYDRELPPGQWGLRKCDPSEYPAFGEAYYSAKGPALRTAVERSLNYMRKPSSRKYYPSGPLTHDQVAAGLTQFLGAIDSSRSPQELDAAIRRDFDVYTSIGCDDAGTVLFTGYYSPIFNGSLTRTDQYKHPIYKLPPDLQKDAEGNPVGGKWRTRRDIENGGALAGNELAYVSDPFEAYVMTVQGSGFIRLPDGQMYEVGYAGHNGYDYTSVGKMLVSDGKIERSQLSLDGMIRHFKAHPEDLDRYVNKNDRYIFFQETSGGPYGCLAEVVTPQVSIATDKDIFPRACLTFVDTQIPRGPGGGKRPFKAFAVDQDRGAAIRAPGRCDIFMGVGDTAGQIAGGTYNEGRLYYLVSKNGGGAMPMPAGDPDDMVHHAPMTPSAQPTQAGSTNRSTPAAPVATINDDAVDGELTRID